MNTKECILEYVVALTNRRTALEDGGDLVAEAIQAGVDEANLVVAETKRAEAAVASVNDILFDDDAGATLTLLKEHETLLELPSLGQSAGSYHDALKASAKVNGNLTAIKIRAAITSVNVYAEAVAAVNACATGDDAALTFTALGHEAIAISGLQTSIASDNYTADGASRYHAALAADPAIGSLDAAAIQSVVDTTNSAMETERVLADALAAVNEAASGTNAEVTCRALQHESLGIAADVDPAGADQYHANLAAALADIDVGALSLEQVIERVEWTNHVAEEDAKHSVVIFRLNAKARTWFTIAPRDEDDDEKEAQVKIERLAKRQ